jgi:hypothetical protein
MPWTDVASKLKFYGPLRDDLGNTTGLDGTPVTVNGVTPYGGAFTLSQKNDILSALQNLYAGSPTARALLDSGVLRSDIWLFHGADGDGSSAIRNSNTAAIDLFQAENFLWMGSDGTFQQEKLGGNVIHELIHAISGLLDLVNPTGPAGAPYDYNNPRFDHLGKTVEQQNKIFQEMGNMGEAAGDTYTNIENLAGSAFTDTLTGDGNANTINGGGGNDFLLAWPETIPLSSKRDLGTTPLATSKPALPSAMSLRSAPHSLRTSRWCKPTHSRLEPTLSLRMTPTIRSH